jgi:hypothetical protein
MGEEWSFLEALLRGDIEGRAGVVCEVVRETAGMAISEVGSLRDCFVTTARCRGWRHWSGLVAANVQVKFACERSGDVWCATNSTFSSSQLLFEDCRSQNTAPAMLSDHYK